MPVYTATMTTDDDHENAFECECRITGDDMVITYWDDDLVRAVEYRGKLDGYTYRLRPVGKAGSATLKRDDPEDEYIMSGTWIEDGEEGTWTVELDDPE